MKDERRRGTPVVINADDFGYGREVNAAIFEASQKACISSATLMANGPAILEALNMAEQLPQLSFGIHLNLTEFAPLLPIHEMKAAGLVDSEGFFLGNAFRQLPPSPRLLQACYEELHQQLLSLHERGLRPSHLDSHHHIHTIPWLLPVVWQLQKKFKLFRIRNTLNVYPVAPGQAPQLQLLAAKKIWQTVSILLGAKMTQRFSALHVFIANPLRTEFKTASSIELMCHPGQFGFEAETQQLLSKGQAILPPGFWLANYCDILSA
ncbi:MAG: ChbG/HpnK family deacetylase [Cyanobacteriota bacterium]|nr:ChbG/HpnK family deacetylase [Cyanobacteriota bacterium]